jgi:ribosomal protein S6--L-glutamate ligase
MEGAPILMKNFNDYFIVEDFEEPIEQDNLHVAVLGKKESGEGTFAEIAEEVCNAKKIAFDSIYVDEAWISQNDVEIGSVTIQNADGKDNSIELETHNTIIFVRAGALESLSAQAIVSSLQSIGFFLVNDLESMLACDNKMTNTLLLERNNLPTPKTSILNNVKSIEDAHKRIGGKFPTIIKTLTGTQGVGVSKVNDMGSLVSVAQSLWKYEADLLLQEFLDIKSDVRTLVVGGNIIGAAERIREEDNSEFRNNVHLGAKTRPYTLSNEEKELVVAAARATGAWYCGVDHCKVKDNYYILEVNGSPGIRSHFNAYNTKTGSSIGKKTDKDMVSLIIDFFSSDLNRRPIMRQEAGFIETVTLEGMENDPIRAKFDTGNSASATMLHVDKLDADGDYVDWVKNGKKFRSEVIGVSEPRRGAKPFDIRPIIEHNLIFNNKKYNVELGLTLKDTASEMLVNRILLSKFKVAINPNRQFMLSSVTERNDTNDH